MKTRIQQFDAGVGPQVFDQTFSKTKTGYPLSAPASNRRSSSWACSARTGPSKTEYLYVDLGRTTDSYTVNGVTNTFSTRVQEHIFRTGLNYHFNSPIVAKY